MFESNLVHLLMKYFFLLLLFIFLTLSGSLLNGQAAMGFENLTTTQTCTNTSCYYVDPGNPAVAHALPDLGGIPVNSPSTTSILGFSSSFRPTRSSGSATGLTDGDYFGYAGSATINDNVGAVPTEGSQAFIIEDSDGEVTLTFYQVELSGFAPSVFTMDYIVDGTFEASDGANDRLYIRLDITGCPAATVVNLVDTDGGRSGGGSGGLAFPTSQVWQTATQDLSAYSACKVQLVIEADLNSSTEEFAFDNIRFTQGLVLPVEFIAFHASQQKTSVILDWATATETDNRGFSVERSMDGRSFTSIGWVAGAGEAQQEVKYTFEDSQVSAGQEYYYRLRQEDFDGAFAYSSIEKIKISGKNSDEVAGEVFPNPTISGLSNLVLSPAEAGEWTVTIVGIQGKVLQETTHSLSAGYQLIPVDLRKFPTGTYLVRIAGEEQTAYRRLIRQ